MYNKEKTEVFFNFWDSNIFTYFTDFLDKYSLEILKKVKMGLLLDEIKNDFYETLSKQLLKIDWDNITSKNYIYMDDKEWAGRIIKEEIVEQKFIISFEGDPYLFFNSPTHNPCATNPPEGQVTEHPKKELILIIEHPKNNELTNFVISEFKKSKEKIISCINNQLSDFNSFRVADNKIEELFTKYINQIQEENKYTKDINNFLNKDRNK